MSEKVVLEYSGLGPVSMPRGEKTGLGMIVIKPGISEVDAKDWPEFKKQKDVAEMLERGLTDPKGCRKDGIGNLVVISDGKEKKADDNGSKEKVPGNQGDAVALVEKTEDTELLKKWLAADERVKVKNALEKKLAEIEAYRKEHGNTDD